MPAFSGSPHAYALIALNLHPPPLLRMRVNPSQVAAATGFQVWEGARALKKMLEDPEMPLSAHIKGKRVLELGSGTGLAGLCASAIGGDVMLSGVPPARWCPLARLCAITTRAPSRPSPRAWLMRMAGWTGACRGRH